MIITVTLNPAVDKTVEINGFHMNGVNRVSSLRLDAGGKGINVSKMIARLGGKSKALGFLGGRTGAFIKNNLDENGIDNEFIPVSGETRTNLKIIDSMQYTNTDINEIGPEITTEDCNRVREQLLSLAQDGVIIVLSGSVPPNINKNIYQQWIKAVKEKGAKVILDADGELMRQGLTAGPYLIKPNIHELEGLLGRKLNNVAEIIHAGKTLMEEYGIEIVAVSMGGDGALFLKKEVAILVQGITVAVKSTVGAGDSMVAALAYALDKGESFEKALTLAVAAGTASVMTCGTEPSSLEEILELEKKVQWEYIIEKYEGCL